MENKDFEYDDYVALHTHSYYSLLDGLSSVDDIINKSLDPYGDGKKRAKAACISDHGVMFSLHELHSKCKEAGQKAITSFEAYSVNDMYSKTNEGDNGRNHLMLWAKNKKGYQKLSFLCSMGCTKGFYYRPRIDDKLIEQVGGEDIIASSACIGGIIPKAIINDDFDKAIEKAKYYNQLFENFYLEIQPTQEELQPKVNMGLLKIAEKLDIPLVATSDSHYTSREDSEIHSMLLAMQSKKSYYDPNRWRFKGDTYFIMNGQDMRQAFEWGKHNEFPKDALEEAIKNTVKIADMCNFELEMGKVYLPKVNIDLSNNPEFLKFHEKKQGIINHDYLKFLCIKSLKEKGLTSKAYRDRLEMEIKTIIDMDFVDYFLIYEDIMRFCRENDIPVGPGRGCHLPDSIVNLADGQKKKIVDVKIGDTVIGHDEKIHNVMKTFEYDCKEEITKLTTENDKKLELTKDHKIYAIKKEDWDKGIREPKWYEANELDEGDYVAELEEED